VEEQGTPVFSYSPDRRTALVLCGTGTQGAYHAGALRALQEAGVKIDVVAGQGVGAAGAALAAIDGGARLWDAGGVWQSDATSTLYGWKPLLRAAGWIAVLLALVLLIPLFVLLIGLLVFLAGFLLTLVGIGSAQALAAAYSSTLDAWFANDNLPTVVPRLAMAVLALLIAVAGIGVLVAQWRALRGRRSAGRWWWRLLAAPLDAGAARELFAGSLWQLIRGAASTATPPNAVLGRRYAEVLAENLGQPGFRELIVVANDLDVRRDVVAALLGAEYARQFIAPQPGRDRRSEVLDLGGIGREQAFDVIEAALTPPLACDPALVTFSSDSYWRGETHRLCDRAGLVNRLFEEVGAAGVTQVIVVSGTSTLEGPHRLAPPRLDLRSRFGDATAAGEAAALRDALVMARLRFDGVYVIRPAHNPIGPFDFTGAYDPASDRHETLAELMLHGYEDACRQFIEPVVGASGEQLVQLPLQSPDAADLPEDGNLNAGLYLRDLEP
jgi:hypothetical protein